LLVLCHPDRRPDSAQSKYPQAMQLLRFLDAEGNVQYASQTPDGPMLLTGDPYAGLHHTGQPAAIAKLLAPIQPTCIIAIGLNYRKHAEETGAKIPEFPVVFFKNPASVQNPGDPIVLPRHQRSDKVDYECELAFVIGKTCKNVKAADAFDYVLGYTVGNDVSARDWQKEWGGRQWCKGKSFDTFCPLGPCIVTPDELPDPRTLGLRTVLNGETMQESNTADMIFGVAELVEFLSGSTTLLPGTVVMTGTPSGVGMARTPPVYLQPGDEVTVEIEGIGALTNPVVEE